MTTILKTVLRRSLRPSSIKSRVLLVTKTDRAFVTCRCKCATAFTSVIESRCESRWGKRTAEILWKEAAPESFFFCAFALAPGHALRVGGFAAPGHPGFRVLVASLARSASKISIFPSLSHALSTFTAGSKTGALIRPASRVSL